MQQEMDRLRNVLSITNEVERGFRIPNRNPVPPATTKLNFLAKATASRLVVRNTRERGTTFADTPCLISGRDGRGGLVRAFVFDAHVFFYREIVYVSAGCLLYRSVPTLCTATSRPNAPL